MGEKRCMNGICMDSGRKSFNAKLWLGEIGMLVRSVIRNGSVDASKREIDGRVEQKGRRGWKRKMNEKT